MKHGNRLFYILFQIDRNTYIFIICEIIRIIIPTIIRLKNMQLNLIEIYAWLR